MTVKAPTNKPSPKVLVLGIGNVLMGDEGIGVAAVRRLSRERLPVGVECLDGGTGSLLLLGPMQEASRVVLIDATADGSPPGAIRRLSPRFSTDYPRTLTAHDVGLKDLLDAFHLLGDNPDVTLFAVSVEPPQDLSTEFSPEIQSILPRLTRMVKREITG